MTAVWNQPRRDFCLVCMQRKWGWLLRNVDTLVNYIFANFRKASRHFHSYLILCKRELYKGRKLADFWRGHLSLHGYVRSDCHFFWLSSMYMTSAFSWLCFVLCFICRCFAIFHWKDKAFRVNHIDWYFELISEKFGSAMILKCRT